jgi:predicted amidophosphoribosyltransferase
MGFKTCEHCLQSMPLWANVCPHCTHRANGIFGQFREAHKESKAVAAERGESRKRKDQAFCDQCNAPLYRGDRNCSNCGTNYWHNWEEQFKKRNGVEPCEHPKLEAAPLDQAFCDRCYEEMYAGDRACSKCGFAMMENWESDFAARQGKPPRARPGQRDAREAQRETRTEPGDVIERLKELAALREAGVVSADEFERLKGRMIA